jgi:hypothetical protein
MDTTDNGAPEGVTEDTAAAELAAEFEQPGADAAAAVVEGEGEGEQPKVEPPKKTAQDRIDELTRARREAEREAAHWRRIAQDGAPRQQEQPAQPKAAEEPNPADYQYGEADPRYIRELARHEARQEFAEQAKARDRDTHVRSVEQTWQSRQAAFAKDHPDFHEVFDRDWPCSPAMADAIKTSDDGAAVAYHLAQNPDEARRIAALTPLAQVRELGRLEAKLTSSATSTPQPKIISTAPDLAPQVRGAGGKFKIAPDTSDFAAFEKQYGC